MNVCIGPVFQCERFRLVNACRPNYTRSTILSSVECKDATLGNCRLINQSSDNCSSKSEAVKPDWKETSANQQRQVIMKMLSAHVHGRIPSLLSFSLFPPLSSQKSIETADHILEKTFQMIMHLLQRRRYKNRNISENFLTVL